jgi:multicomponent K+:H+ antiporter subunit G
MSGNESLEAWIAIPVALLLILGGSISLIGAFGLLRLPNFYQRMHAPALIVTLGTGCVLLASMLYFSLSASRLVVHELIISAFILLSAPVVSMLLLRAAIYRDLRARKPEIAAMREMLVSDSTKK